MVEGNLDHQSSADVQINYQSGTNGNKNLGVGNYREKSAITGMLCKQVLAYVKCHQGCYLGVDTSVMDLLGCWL
jgi:hypothetical protein